MASERRHFGWTCKLCCSPVINIDRYVLPSCCKKEYLHWNCLQDLVDKGEASSFHCPLCASEDEFVESMKSVGISFPVKMKPSSSPAGTANGNSPNHDWKWTPRNKKQEELFKKAKDELHTFLAMNKEGIRLNEAFNMMFSQAAITIPLREMGFDNFYHFIYNCQEVSSLKQLPDKKDLYLFVKGHVDAHITHIRALVQKQKWRDRVPSSGVRVTPGNTYEADPTILLRYRGRARETLPIVPKSDRPVEEEPEETGKVSAEVVHVIPLNKAAAADPRNLVVLPSKSSTRKSNNRNKAKVSGRIDEHVTMAASSENEPQEFKARLLGVDQHGWFYVRAVTEQVAHWDKFMREFKGFYESDEVQKTMKLESKDVCLGATVAACYTPQSSGDHQKKRFGRVTILRIDDKGGHCTVQDIDNSDIGDAAISDLYMMEERFTEDERPRGAVRVALAGTEMFILSGRLRRKFSELKLIEIATVTVVEECHPTFECPVVSIQVRNEKSVRYEDLKSLLNL